MTIYILDQDPKMTAQYLDDKSLDRMIRDIAQVLCNVHYMKLAQKSPSEGCVVEDYEAIPLMPSDYLSCKWSFWDRECRANYLFMVELGIALCEEYDYRFCYAPDEHLFAPGLHKMTRVIVWARDNVPDLPCSSSMDLITPLPLVMPEKYITVDDWMIPPQNVHAIILSYRNYYQSKIKRICPNGMCDKDHNVRWTRREIPVWLYIC